MIFKSIAKDALFLSFSDLNKNNRCVHEGAVEAGPFTPCGGAMRVPRMSASVPWGPCRFVS